MRLPRKFREIYLGLCLAINNKRVIDNITPRDMDTLISLFYVFPHLFWPK